MFSPDFSTMYVGILLCKICIAKKFFPSSFAPYLSIYMYSLYRTLETLFWAGFNLIELDTLDMGSSHYFTEWAGKTMFGTFNVIAIVVLLNMLIAMMSTSYAEITVSYTVLETCPFNTLLHRFMIVIT